MNTEFKTPRGSRFFIFAAMSLFALDFMGVIAPEARIGVRFAIGLCGIAAVAWFLASFMRSRR